MLLFCYLFLGGCLFCWALAHATGMNLQKDSSEALSSNIVLHIAGTAPCYSLIVKGGFVGLFVNFYLLGF